MKNIFLLVFLIICSSTSYSQQHSLSFDFLGFVYVPQAPSFKIGNMALAYNYHHPLKAKTNLIIGARYDVLSYSNQEGLITYSNKFNSLKIPLGIEYSFWKQHSKSLKMKGGIMLEYNMTINKSITMKDTSGDIVGYFFTATNYYPHILSAWSLGAFAGIRYQPFKRVFGDLQYLQSFRQHYLTEKKNTKLGQLVLGIGIYL